NRRRIAKVHDRSEAKAQRVGSVKARLVTNAAATLRNNPERRTTLAGRKTLRRFSSAKKLGRLHLRPNLSEPGAERSSARLACRCATSEFDPPQRSPVDYAALGDLKARLIPTELRPGASSNRVLCRRCC